MKRMATLQQCQQAYDRQEPKSYFENDTKIDIQDATYGDTLIDTLINKMPENKDYFLAFLEDETTHKKDERITCTEANQLCDDFIEYLKREAKS